MCVSGSQGKVGQGIEYSEACCQCITLKIGFGFFFHLFLLVGG